MTLNIPHQQQVYACVHFQMFTVTILDCPMTVLDLLNTT